MQLVYSWLQQTWGKGIKIVQVMYNYQNQKWGGWSICRSSPMVKIKEQIRLFIFAEVTSEGKWQISFQDSTQVRARRMSVTLEIGPTINSNWSWHWIQLVIALKEGMSEWCSLICVTLSSLKILSNTCCCFWKGTIILWDRLW